MISDFKAYISEGSEKLGTINSVYVDLGMEKYWNFDVMRLYGTVLPIMYLNNGLANFPENRTPIETIDLTKDDLNTILEEFVHDLDDSEESDKIFELLDMHPEIRTSKDWEDLINMSSNQVNPKRVTMSFIHACDRIFKRFYI